MILVTGATGHIGRELVSRLADEGAAVRALARTPPKAALPAGVDVTTSGSGYVAVSHSSTGTDFTLAKRADGTVRRTCAPSGGACPSGGSW